MLTTACNLLAIFFDPTQREQRTVMFTTCNFKLVHSSAN